MTKKELLESQREPLNIKVNQINQEHDTIILKVKYKIM